MKLEVRTELRPYEVVVIMHPDSTEEEQKTLFKKNKSIVESFAGSVYSLDTWGKRGLGNQIDGHKRAYYFHATFEAKPSAVAELERTMRINDRVLRFQHTRLPEGTQLSKFMENFKKALADSATREREREAKFQQRKAARMGGGGRRDDFGGEGERGGFDRGERGGFGRGDRGDRGERGDRGDLN